MIKTILGLDVSTKTGMVLLDFETKRPITTLQMNVPNRTGKRGQLIPSMVRANKYRTMLDEHLLPYNKTSMIGVIEGYAFGPKQSKSSIITTVEIGTLFRLLLSSYGIPYILVPPTSLKKFATGSGGANKDEMVAKAATEGFTAKTHDIVDAYWLCRFGRHLVDCLKTSDIDADLTSTMLMEDNLDPIAQFMQLIAKTS